MGFSSSQGALHVPRDVALIGKTAVEILVEEADDPTLAPRQVVFQPELVVRASTTG